MQDDTSPLTTRHLPPLTTLAALLTLVFLAVLIRTAWLSDDALISLRTVLNVTHGFGLTFNIAERVQTFTHPLWLWLVVAAYLVGGNLFWTTLALSIAVSVTAFWMALKRAASASQVWLAAIVLLFSRAFVDFSTSGLENPLAHLLVAALIVAALRRHPDRTGWLVAVWAIASLLYLTRPDLALFAAPFVVMASHQARSVKRVIRAAIVGTLPAVAWTLFSLLYYGFPFPNTAYAKLGTGISRGALWHQGMLYLVDSLDRDPLTLVAVAFAVLVGLATPNAVARASAVGVVAYVVYIVSIGGDFMAGRFLTVPLFASVLILCWLTTGPRSLWLAAAGLSVIVGSTSDHIPLWSDSRFDDAGIRANGIADERGVYFRDWSVSRAGRKTFRAPGWPVNTGVRPRPEVTNTCGQLGAGGLDVGPYHHLLDECALADPLLARMPAIFNEDWRIGHFHRMVPDGYVESLEKGENRLTDRNLHAFYEDLRLITRSPDLLSSERLAAIVRTNTGRLDGLVNDAFYRHQGSIVPLDRLTGIKANEVPWNDPGVHQLTLPLAVVCPDRPGRRYLDISSRFRRPLPPDIPQAQCRRRRPRYRRDSGIPPAPGSRHSFRRYPSGRCAARLRRHRRLASLRERPLCHRPSPHRGRRHGSRSVQAPCRSRRTDSDTIAKHKVQSTKYEVRNQELRWFITLPGTWYSGYWTLVLLDT